MSVNKHVINKYDVIDSVYIYYVEYVHPFSVRLNAFILHTYTHARTHKYTYTHTHIYMKRR